MNVLEKILLNKKEELEKVKSNWDLFKEVFVKKEANIIWEIKLNSPSWNISRNSLESLEKITSFYWENSQIKAVSNLIDKKFFSWDVNIWTNFKQKYNKPIFFKEFVISRKQIDWASYFGYDSLLLIKRILSKDVLMDFILYSKSKNIFPIVEVDNQKDFEEVLELLQDLDFAVALNSRNLDTLEINKNFHFEIYEKFQNELKNKIIFAFSWINSEEEQEKYIWKFNWVLIWSYFINKIC